MRRRIAIISCLLSLIAALLLLTIWQLTSNMPLTLFHRTSDADSQTSRWFAFDGGIMAGGTFIDTKRKWKRESDARVKALQDALENNASAKTVYELVRTMHPSDLAHMNWRRYAELGGQQDGFAWTRSPQTILRQYMDEPSTNWSRLGPIQVYRRSDEFGSIRFLTLPLWPLPLLLGLPSAVYLAYRLRLWRQVCRGHCPSCGYDLRATPTRCPECGASIPDAPL